MGGVKEDINVPFDEKARILTISILTLLSRPDLSSLKEELRHHQQHRNPRLQAMTKCLV